MKIKEFEFKLFYSPEEEIEINNEFKKVCKPDVDYSETGTAYKVGYITAKAGRLARGEPLHGEEEINNNRKDNDEKREDRKEVKH